ncbi:endonuclease IV, partial [Xanthomonas citri pv. citri]|nr:endonuclease IV [Xanthomonas citri pv. citri]
MAEEAVSINANTFQYFTRNPRGGAAKELNPKDIEAYKAYAAEHSIGSIVAYAPYDVEPASSDAHKQDFAEVVLTEDLKR